jgi:type III secretory pathway component EscT
MNVVILAPRGETVCILADFLSQATAVLTLPASEGLAAGRCIGMMLIVPLRDAQTTLNDSSRGAQMATIFDPLSNRVR